MKLLKTPIVLAFALLMGVSDVSAAAPVKPPPRSYTLINLGALKTSRSLGELGGSVHSEALGINNRGQVVGNSGHGFLWENGKLTDLAGIEDAMQDRSRGYAWDINEKGKVAGSSGSYGPVVMSGLPFAAAYLFSKGEFRRLGEPEWSSLEAYGINDHDQIVGSSSYRGFLWDRGKFTQIGTFSHRPNGNGSRAARIDNRGRIVGAATVDRKKWNWDLPVHAFLWQRGRMKDLGTLPSYENSAATDLNERGEVVGYTSHASYWRQAGLGEPGHAFLWKRGKMKDLGVLRGATDSRANAINNRGEIAGESGGRAVLWRDGLLRDLNTLIPKNTGWTLVKANDLNDRGQIVGAGRKGKNPDLRAFLLTPR